MAFNIAGLQGMAGNIAQTVRDIESAQVTLESNRAALVARVQALADDDWEAGPLDACRVQVDEIALLRTRIKAFVKALCDQAVTVTGKSLSDWFSDNRALGDRLPPEFGQLVRANAGEFDPRCIWPPFETPMGECAFPGAVLDQALAASPIDSRQYAAAKLKVKTKVASVTTDNMNPVHVKIAGIQYNGDAWEGSADIPHDSLIGTEVPVTPTIADTFCLAVTGMTVSVSSGGVWTAGEFDVLTDDDTAPAP